jgi:hypothetical protein
MNICFYPTLLANRKVFLVMGNRALYVTFDNQIFVGRKFAFEYKCWSDH